MKRHLVILSLALLVVSLGTSLALAAPAAHSSHSPTEPATGPMMSSEQMQSQPCDMMSNNSKDKPCPPNSNSQK